MVGLHAFKGTLSVNWLPQAALQGSGPSGLRCVKFYYTPSNLFFTFGIVIVFLIFQILFNSSFKAEIKILLSFVFRIASLI